MRTTVRRFFSALGGPTLVLMLVNAPLMAASANVHDVGSLMVVPTTSAPKYDLEKIANNAQDSKGYKAGLAILKVGYILGMGGASGSDYRCVASGGLEGLCALAAVANDIAKSVETTANAAQAAGAFEQLRQMEQNTGVKELGQDFSASLESVINSAYVQTVLATTISQYVSSNLKISSSLQDTSASHQLLVQISKVQTEGSFVNSKISIRLFGDAQLLGTQDDEVLESYSLSVETPELDLEDWEKGGPALLGKAFQDAITELGIVLAEESLTVVTSPKQKKKGYLVESLEPKNKVCLFGCKKKTVKNYGFYNSESLAPVFRWVDFQEAYKRDPLYPETPLRAEDIAYDLRIYETLKLPSMADLYGPGELLHEERNIKDSSYTPAFELKPCTAYMWTVRTRFIVNDRLHLTRWSGNYKEKDLDKWRDKVGSPTRMDKFNLIGGAIAGKQDQQIFYREGSYYYPFMTHSPTGKCKT
jgi:hypothetical protein